MLPLPRYANAPLQKNNHDALSIRTQERLCLPSICLSPLQPDCLADAALFALVDFKAGGVD
jgi:hypothetical protein